MGDHLPTIDMGRKMGGCRYAPFRGMELCPHLTQYGLGRSLQYLCTKWHLDPSSRLATTDIGRKLEWGSAPFGRSWAPSNTMWLGQRSVILYQVAPWSVQPLEHNRHGPKVGAAVPLFWGARSPSNTVWPGPRPTHVPSGISIYPAVWPQKTWAEKWKSGGNAVSPFWRGVHIYPNVAWAEANLLTKWHLHPFSRLATTEMGRKWGAVPLLGGAGSPSNTMSPGPRPISTPSDIWIHLTVWPQQTWAENWGATGPLLAVKAIFSEGSLKLCALESIFSERVHWKCRNNILFSVKRSLKLWALRSIFSEWLTKI